MADVERISMEEAHEKVKANQTLLVVADDNEDKYRMPEAV
jgi:hypothetical protein